MKIYKNNKIITSVNKPNFDDIPICYVNSYDNFKDINISNVKIQENIKRPLMPFEKFDTLNIALFDKNENQIDHSKLFERESNSNLYSYTPKGRLELVPTYFNTKITIKKKIKNANNRKFNISAACDNIHLAKNLIKIFGDANVRNIGKSNISVNNNDTSEMSLINKSYNNTDIIFIESSDGYHHKKSGEKINFNDLFDNNTNAWIGVDSFENLTNEKVENIGFVIGDEQIAKHETITEDGHGLGDIQIPEVKTTMLELKNINHSFNIEKEYSFIKDYDFIIHKIFNNKNYPLLLLEKENKSFIIISHNEMLDNMSDNINLLYALLEYIYFNSYKTLSINNLWISYYPINYVAYSNKIYNMCHPPININNLMCSNNLRLTKNEYELCDIITNDDNIKFNKIDDKNFLYFKKINKEINDRSDENYISFLSQNNTIIYYTPDVFIIETIPNIEFLTNEDGIKYLKINPIKSTKYNINMEKEKNFEMLSIDYSKTYQLIINNNIIEISKIDDTVNNKNTALCNIDFIADPDFKIIDLRQAGGGLSKKEKDNYNLFDIGSVLGRPYRKGNTTIVTLPQDCEQYDNIIKSELKKHSLGEDFIIVLYE